LSLVLKPASQPLGEPSGLQLVARGAVSKRSQNRKLSARWRQEETASRQAVHLSKYFSEGKQGQDWRNDVELPPGPERRADEVDNAVSTCVTDEFHATARSDSLDESAVSQQSYR
jgi:hypothetical protein